MKQLRRMQTKMKISEIFDQWGIFTALQNKHPPWESDITPLTFDIYYKTSRGEKICTPFLEHFAPMNESKINIIATFLIELYGNNWSKEYNTLNLVYNPIENYRMTETETNATETTATDSHTENATATETATGTTETDVNSTNSTEQTSNNTSTDKKSAYKSQSFVNDRQKIDNGELSSEQSDDAHTETSTQKTGTATNALTSSKNENVATDTSRELTRSGNIGVTTSQQMIQSERELYIWNFFLDVVFPDLDKIFTLKCY